MKNKVIVFGLILITSVIVLPNMSHASSEASGKAGRVTNYEYSATGGTGAIGTPQRRGRGGRGRGRGRGSDDHLEGGHRSRGSHHARRSHRTRIVKKVYYRNGRRYVRNVRIHH